MKKDHIIRRCTEIFLTDGFARVSMDHLAQELGLSKKTIYKYFSSKEELVRTVLLEFRDGTIARVEAILEEVQLDQYQKLVRVLETIGERVSKIERRLLEDLRKHMPEFWIELDVKRQTVLRKVFSEILVTGKTNGIIREDTDVDFFLMMYLNLVTALANPDVLVRIPYSPSQVFRNIAEVMFMGVLTDSARKKYRSEHGLKKG